MSSDKGVAGDLRKRLKKVTHSYIYQVLVQVDEIFIFARFV